MASKRVLFVEDMPSLRKVGALMVRNAGAHVEVAADGAPAVEMVASSLKPGGRPYNCVLMDMHMPGMNGLQALRAIRAAHGANAPPIVCVTGDVLGVEAGGRQQTMTDAGAVGSLAKPYSQEDLKAAVLKYST